MSVLHTDALTILSDWTAPDDRQELLRRRLVEHLRQRPDGMRRSCLPDHITASLIVWDDALERVLLTLHRKAGRWFQFGGHCEDADRSLRGAATREGLEESGLADLTVTARPVHLDIHPVPFCSPGHTVHHLDVRYAARALPGAEPTISAESLDVRWFAPDAVPDLEPTMRELFTLSRRALLDQPER